MILIARVRPILQNQLQNKTHNNTIDAATIPKYDLYKFILGYDFYLVVRS